MGSAKVKRITLSVARTSKSMSLNQSFSNLSNVDLHRTYLGQNVLLLSILSLIIELHTYRHGVAVPIAKKSVAWMGYTRDRHLGRLDSLIDEVNPWKFLDFENAEGPFSCDQLKDRTKRIRLQVRQRWHQFQTCWPIDCLSSVSTIVFYITRQVRRSKMHTYDAAPMFAMNVVLLLSTSLESLFFEFNFVSTIHRSKKFYPGEVAQTMKDLAQ
ncbi:unnamed protein product [Calicophoron daubneyi]|uniref:Uncharacterized protein n=1 Tax=Calicophoron daubneyi TaxID=300641 RepID=A0AAV2TU69_CALDB